MKLIYIPENASPEVKLQSVQKQPHVVDFFFCRRAERAAIYLFRRFLISDWIWYRYEFQIRGSDHAHGTMNLKLSPDILDMATKVYAGNKET